MQVSCSWCANWIFAQGKNDGEGIYTRERFQALDRDVALDMEGQLTCNHLKFQVPYEYSLNHISMLQEFWDTSNKSKSCPYSCLHHKDEKEYNYWVVNEGKGGL